MKEKRKERELYRLLLNIALPITLQSLFQSTLTVMDELMVGQLGKQSIAAVAFGNRLFEIYLYVVMALASAMAVFIAQYWGEKDLEGIKQTIRLPIKWGILSMLLFTGAAFGFARPIIGLFTHDQSVIPGAVRLQKIYFISALPVLITYIYANLLRSMEKVKLPMYTGILSVVLNTLLNYIFIFGKLGMKPLGAEGAALATLLARLTESMILFISVHGFKYPLHLPVFKLLTESADHSFKKHFLKTAWPMLIMNILFALVQAQYMSIYGRMGTEEVAAVSIMFPIQGFSIGLFSGLSSATAIILGKELGRKHFEEAFEYGQKILSVSFKFIVLVSIVLGIGTKFYLSFYKIDDSIYEKAFWLIIVVAIFLVVRVENMIIGQGIIQSGGNMKFMLYLDIFGMWCIGLPLAYLSAFVLKLPIYWVYVFISLEEVVRLIIGIFKFYKKDWMINLVSESSNL